MRNIVVIPILLFLVTGANLFPQSSVESDGFVVNPMPTGSGIIFTDNYASAIYRSTSAGTTTLISSPGSGNYYVVSPDGKTIGFKLIDRDGRQSPALLTVATGEVTRLHAPVEMAGQVSFTHNGGVAFTVGSALYVVRGAETTTFDLKTYSNLAPISPAGTAVVFNDGNDQLWLMDLDSHERTRLTDSRRGYFNPQWATNGERIVYSSLNGTLSVYDLARRTTYLLGDGANPSWSEDSRRVIFYRKEIDKDKVVNSDIYLTAFDGSETVQLTRTPDICEMDARLIDHDTRMIYQTYGTKEIHIARVADNTTIEKRATRLPKPSPLPLREPSMPPTLEKNAIIDMPYVNQVYDTPDWYNGHAACGPTSSIMVIAYYDLLPSWEVWCSASGPSPGHYSSYGNYVCEKYRFRQIDYSYIASDPNGKSSWGGYGFMWTGSNSPHSRMVNYYANHGLSASLIDSPPFSLVVSELGAGYPYTLCNGLTTAGHIIVLLGVDSAKHVVTVNDPYGNKNSGSYPSVNGKNVKYDWPAYNNGNQNLNTAWWGVTVRYAAPPSADTVVDDLQFNGGFFMNNRAPATMYSWKDLNRGYNGHMWYAFTTWSDSVDTCFAVWQPTLSKPGMYEVLAYIPTATATAAKYKVYHKGGVQTVVINQKNYTDSSASLGTYEFDAGSTGYVRLGDATGIKNEAMIFDAMIWRHIGPASVFAETRRDAPRLFALEQNYPTPFNPRTAISFQSPVVSMVTLRVFDVLGREVATLVNEERGPGSYSVRWEAADFPAGVYFYQLSAGDFLAARKMVLLK